MTNEIHRHSLLKSVLLHLLPGIFTGILYFAVVPVVKENGYPSVMGLIIAALIVLIPFETGVLLYQKKVTGEKLFNGVIRYIKPMPVWQFFLFIPLVFILTGLLFKALEFTSDYLQSFFSWLPSGRLLDMGLEAEYSKSKLITTYLLFLLFIVLIGPATEEIYFRGFLLPRMPERLKGWTEITHSGLFALYHTWTPWMIVVRTIGVLPLIYTVRRKENIYIGIISHCLINSVDFIIGVLYILSL